MSKQILMRASLTEDEWKEVRKLAIDLGQPLSDVLAALIRKHLLNKEA